MELNVKLKLNKRRVVHKHNTQRWKQLADDEADAVSPQTVVRDERKVGRNEPCPCGSGKKYKQCHGKID